MSKIKKNVSYNRPKTSTEVKNFVKRVTAVATQKQAGSIIVLENKSQECVQGAAYIHKMNKKQIVASVMASLNVELADLIGYLGSVGISKKD